MSNPASPSLTKKNLSGIGKSNSKSDIQINTNVGNNNNNSNNSKSTDSPTGMVRRKSSFDIGENNGKDGNLSSSRVPISSPTDSKKNSLKSTGSSSSFNASAEDLRSIISDSKNKRSSSSNLLKQTSSSAEITTIKPKETDSVYLDEITTLKKRIAAMEQEQKQTSSNTNNAKQQQQYQRQESEYQLLLRLAQEEVANIKKMMSTNENLWKKEKLIIQMKNDEMEQAYEVSRTKINNLQEQADSLYSQNTELKSKIAEEVELTVALRETLTGINAGNGNIENRKTNMPKVVGATARKQAATLIQRAYKAFKFRKNYKRSKEMESQVTVMKNICNSSVFMKKVNAGSTCDTAKIKISDVTVKFHKDIEKQSVIYGDYCICIHIADKILITNIARMTAAQHQAKQNREKVSKILKQFKTIISPETNSNATNRDDEEDEENLDIENEENSENHKNNEDDDLDANAVEYEYDISWIGQIYEMFSILSSDHELMVELCDVNVHTGIRSPICSSTIRFKEPNSFGLDEKIKIETDLATISCNLSLISLDLMKKNFSDMIRFFQSRNWAIPDTSQKQWDENIVTLQERNVICGNNTTINNINNNNNFNFISGVNDIFIKSTLHRDNDEYGDDEDKIDPYGNSISMNRRMSSMNSMIGKSISGGSSINNSFRTNNNSNKNMALNLSQTITETFEFNKHEMNINCLVFRISKFSVTGAPISLLALFKKLCVEVSGGNYYSSLRTSAIPSSSSVLEWRNEDIVVQFYSHDGKISFRLIDSVKYIIVGLCTLTIDELLVKTKESNRIKLKLELTESVMRKLKNSSKTTLKDMNLDATIQFESFIKVQEKLESMLDLSGINKMIDAEEETNVLNSNKSIPFDSLIKLAGGKTSDNVLNAISGCNKVMKISSLSLLLETNLLPKSLVASTGLNARQLKIWKKRYFIATEAKLFQFRLQTDGILSTNSPIHVISYHNIISVEPYDSYNHFKESNNNNMTRSRRGTATSMYSVDDDIGEDEEEEEEEEEDEGEDKFDGNDALNQEYDIDGDDYEVTGSNNIEISGSEKMKRFVMVLKNGDVLQLKAENHQERDEWLNLITFLCENIAFHTNGNASGNSNYGKNGRSSQYLSSTFSDSVFLRDDDNYCNNNDNDNDIISDPYIANTGKSPKVTYSPSITDQQQQQQQQQQNQQQNQPIQSSPERILGPSDLHKSPSMLILASKKSNSLQMYLYKMGPISLSASWNQRWFVLENDRINWYRKAEEAPATVSKSSNSSAKPRTLLLRCIQSIDYGLHLKGKNHVMRCNTTIPEYKSFHLYLINESIEAEWVAGIKTRYAILTKESLKVTQATTKTRTTTTSTTNVKH